LAEKLCIPVPDLYWHGMGKDIDKIPFDTFPECYVVKPANAWSCVGVFVMKNGVNLFDGKKYNHADLRRELKKIAKRFPKSMILVEEMVTTESGEHKVPIDYKCHLFGGKLESILAIRRRDGHSGWASFYDKNWKNKGGANTSEPTLHIAPYKPEIISAPKELKTLVEYSERMGSFYGSFVRMDFYSTAKGIVFSEVTHFPNAGGNYNRYADKWIEKWKELDPKLFKGKIEDGQIVLNGVKKNGVDSKLLKNSGNSMNPQKLKISPKQQKPKTSRKIVTYGPNGREVSYV
jgi:hypothetical protein